MPYSLFRYIVNAVNSEILPAQLFIYVHLKSKKAKLKRKINVVEARRNCDITKDKIMAGPGHDTSSIHIWETEPEDLFLPGSSTSNPLSRLYCTIYRPTAWGIQPYHQQSRKTKFSPPVHVTDQAIHSMYFPRSDITSYIWTILHCNFNASLVYTCYFLVLIFVNGKAIYTDLAQNFEKKAKHYLWKFIGTIK